MNNIDISSPRAYGEPLCKVAFRRSPEDFIVNESLVFEPDGEGEHVYLHIKKRNTNTQWLARELAHYAGMKLRDVSYAGLKDRNAVTTQWFSLLLHSDKEPDWRQFTLHGIDILQVTRHRTKLRPGMAKKNQFIITLYADNFDEQALHERLQLIQQQGVPNYFGEQRFGHDANNIVQARDLFAGKIKVKSRQKKGLYLSAARSYLYNLVLAERVRQGNWHTALAGDCMMLDGSNSFFAIEQPDAEILSRLQRFDIHPTGPLWGAGAALTSLDALELESDILKDDSLLQQGLADAGLKMDRRALRMKPMSIGLNMISTNALQLMFELGPGQYATTLLHELFMLERS